MENKLYDVRSDNVDLNRWVLMERNIIQWNAVVAELCYEQAIKFVRIYRGKESSFYKLKLKHFLSKLVWN